jgi:hypothetical protein
MTLRKPTKYLSLDLLLQIRDNYYRHPASNEEYQAEEIDYLINQKLDKAYKEASDQRHETLLYRFRVQQDD